MKNVLTNNNSHERRNYLTIRLHEQKVAGQKGVATFDEFIANIIESVKDNNGTVQDAIYIANDAFAKL